MSEEIEMQKTETGTLIPAFRYPLKGSRPVLPEYKLTKRVGNSFFFQNAKGTGCMESFTVTYTIDGLAVMSGDYYNLIWRRTWWPEEEGREYDYGFPFADTEPGYFSEKVWNAINSIPFMKEPLQFDERYGYQFDLLRSVSHLILEEVEKNP